MPQYPKPTPGAYSAPYKNVAPQGPQYVEGAAMRKQASIAKQFEGLSASLGEATGIAQQQFNKEDFEKGQQMIMAGEKDFRQKEADGELVITPPMQRGISTMQGKVDGQAFITKYQQAYAGSTDEQLRDPSYAKTLYEQMLSTDVSSDKKGNPHYAGSFLTMTSHPEGKGENQVLHNTIGAEGRLRDYGITLLGSTGKETAANLTVTEIDPFTGVAKIWDLDADPASPDAPSDLQVVEAVTKSMGIDIDGDGTPDPATGMVKTGSFGDGTWSSNNDKGGTEYLNGLHAGLRSRNLNPQILLDAINAYPDKDGRKFSEQRVVREWVQEYKKPGGDFDKDKRAFLAKISEGRIQVHQDLDLALAAMKDAAGPQRLDVDALNVAMATALELNEKAFHGFPEEQSKVAHAIRLHQLSLGNAITISQNASKTATANAIQKTAATTLAVHAARASIVKRLIVDSKSATPYDQPGNDAYLTGLSEQFDLPKSKLSTIYTEELLGSIRSFAEDLRTKGIPSIDPAGNLIYTPIHEGEQVTQLGQYYYNLAQMGDTGAAEIQRQWKTLHRGFLNSTEKEEYLNSTDGLSLMALAKASTVLKKNNYLQDLVKTGAGIGDSLEAIAAHIGPDFSTDDIRKSLIANWEENQIPGDPSQDLPIDTYQQGTFAYNFRKITLDWGPFGGGGGGANDAAIMEAIGEEQDRQGVESGMFSHIAQSPQHSATIAGLAYEETSRIWNAHKGGQNPRSMEAAFKEAIEGIVSRGVLNGKSEGGHHTMIMESNALRGAFMEAAGYSGDSKREIGEAVHEVADYLSLQMLTDEESEELDNELAQRIADGDITVDQAAVIARDANEYGFEQGDALNITVIKSGEWIITNAETDSVDDTYVLSQQDATMLASKMNERKKKLLLGSSGDTTSAVEVSNVLEISDDEFVELKAQGDALNDLGVKMKWEQDRPPTVQNFTRIPREERENRSFWEAGKSNRPIFGYVSQLAVPRTLARWGPVNKAWNSTRDAISEGWHGLKETASDLHYSILGEDPPDRSPWETSIRGSEQVHEWPKPVSGVLPLPDNGGIGSKVNQDLLYDPNYTIAVNKTNGLLVFWRAPIAPRKTTETLRMEDRVMYPAESDWHLQTSPQHIRRITRRNSYEGTGMDPSLGTSSAIRSDWQVIKAGRAWEDSEAYREWRNGDAYATQQENMGNFIGVLNADRPRHMQSRQARADYIELPSEAERDRELREVMVQRFPGGDYQSEWSQEFWKSLGSPSGRPPWSLESQRNVYRKYFGSK